MRKESSRCSPERKQAGGPTPAAGLMKAGLGPCACLSPRSIPGRCFWCPSVLISEGEGRAWASYFLEPATVCPCLIENSTLSATHLTPWPPQGFSDPNLSPESIRPSTAGSSCGHDLSGFLASVLPLPLSSTSPPQILSCLLGSSSSTTLF